MFVYRLATSIVTMRQSGGCSPKLRSLERKCVVSLMYEGSSGMVGSRKKSTSWEILSLGQALHDTIGRPGGLFNLLCILGSI